VVRAAAIAARRAAICAGVRAGIANAVIMARSYVAILPTVEPGAACARAVGDAWAAFSAPAAAANCPLEAACAACPDVEPGALLAAAWPTEPALP
jgi:hypothetical protein